MIAGFASLGLPGTSGFVAELAVFLGAFSNFPWHTGVAAFGVVLSAGYILWMIQRTMFGAELQTFLEVEDFVFLPFKRSELATRIRRALWRTGSWDSGQVIRTGDLIIDQERYEVSVAGRRVILTFKEYQLLCLLATNPGRVYSRETLLSRVWEYDYFGGTRTVDVHIRRLRSKVEDASHLFIETVRNVGYRFRVG